VVVVDKDVHPAVALVVYDDTIPASPLESNGKPTAGKTIPDKTRHWGLIRHAKFAAYGNWGSRKDAIGYTNGVFRGIGVAARGDVFPAEACRHGDPADP